MTILPKKIFKGSMWNLVTPYMGDKKTIRRIKIKARTLVRDWNKRKELSKTDVN